MRMLLFWPEQPQLASCSSITQVTLSGDLNFLPGIRKAAKESSISNLFGDVPLNPNLYTCANIDMHYHVLQRDAMPHLA